MNHLKTGKNREEVKCEESLIYRVDVLRNSASNVDRLPQIWQIPANYPLWSFIPQNTTDYNFIPKYPFMTSFPSLVQARFLLLNGFSHQVPPFSTVTAATSRRHFEFSTSNLKKSGWNFSSWDSKSWRMRIRDSVPLSLVFTSDASTGASIRLLISQRKQPQWKHKHKHKRKHKDQNFSFSCDCVVFLRLCLWR